MEASQPNTVSKPCLPRGVRLKYDETRSEWLLLAPERVIKLDACAVAGEVPPVGEFTCSGAWILSYIER